MSKLAGLWLPIITPFADGVIDVQSYESLLEHYLGQDVAGIFPLGTTGEAPTIDAEEVERIVDLTMRVVAGRVPVFVGIGGNATRKVIKVLKRLERYPFAGLVSVGPAKVVTLLPISPGRTIWGLAEGVGFEYHQFSAGISTFPKSTHVRTHEQRISLADRRQSPRICLASSFTSCDL
jgi:hypothetical protein